MSTKQDHKRWRKNFNEVCLKRDRNKCVFCNITENLDVHHITDRHEMPNGGYAPENGITLCQEHHLKCEQYHMGNETEFIYLPEQLYNMIGIDYDTAYLECENLE